MRCHPFSPADTILFHDPPCLTMGKTGHMLSKAPLPGLTRRLLLFVIIAIALGLVGCTAAPQSRLVRALISDNVSSRHYPGQLVAYDVLHQGQRWRDGGGAQRGNGSRASTAPAASPAAMSLYGTPSVGETALHRRLQRRGAGGWPGWLRGELPHLRHGQGIVGSVTIDGDTLYVGTPMEGVRPGPSPCPTSATA